MSAQLATKHNTRSAVNAVASPCLRAARLFGYRYYYYPRFFGGLPAPDGIKL